MSEQDKELEAANRHVSQLERINEALAKECDRLRKELNERRPNPNQVV